MHKPHHISKIVIWLNKYISTKSSNYGVGVRSMAKRLTHYLLIALILSLGFGQLLRFEVMGLPIFLHDILILFLIPLLFTYRPACRQGRVRKFLLPTWFKLIALGLTIGAIRALTLFPLADLLIPFLYSFRLLSYLAFYLSLRHKPLAISHKLFILSGLISLTIGLTQYFLMPDMRIFQYLGWDDHLSRLTLPHFDPTFSGAMLVMYLFFAFTSRISIFSSSTISHKLLVIYHQILTISHRFSF